MWCSLGRTHSHPPAHTHYTHSSKSDRDRAMALTLLRISCGAKREREWHNCCCCVLAFCCSHIPVASVASSRSCSAALLLDPCQQVVRGSVQFSSIFRHTQHTHHTRIPFLGLCPCPCPCLGNDASGYVCVQTEQGSLPGGGNPFGQVLFHFPCNLCVFCIIYYVWWVCFYRVFDRNSLENTYEKYSASKIFSEYNIQRVKTHTCVKNHAFIIPKWVFSEFFCD